MFNANNEKNWPKDTEIKKNRRKIEIELPQPMTGKQIEDATRKPLKKIHKIKKTTFQKNSNVDTENKLKIETEKLFFPKKLKKNHSRQEQIRQERKKERVFKEDTNWGENNPSL